MASCLLLFGLVVLIKAFVACGVAFFAPFWLKALDDGHTEGLWGYCSTGADCQWFFEYDYGWEKHLPDWFKASQALFAFGYVMLVAVLLIAIFHVCCLCCRESFSMPTIIGVILLCSTVTMTLGLAVFGGMAFKDPNYRASLHSITFNFEWGFYVGIAGVILSFLASIIFLITLCRGKDSREGYHRGSVM